MSNSDHHHELIQKYLDALASPAQLAELEGLLAADPEVANAFAEAARLHAGLQDYFQKQYKMDQVASLLNTPATPGSTFVPGHAPPTRSRQSQIAGRLGVLAHRWKWFAAAALLLAIGVVLWSSAGLGEARVRVVSGRVAVDGRDTTEIPENAVFEVVGNDAAAIELPGGARIELVVSSRASFRREPNRINLRLESEGGEFSVPRGQVGLGVETALGVVTATNARFSVNLMTALPPGLTPTEPIRLPRLVVAVAHGSVVVEHAGVLTRLSAGEEHVFLNET